MANTEITLYVTKAGTEFECTVNATGDVTEGGSNRYGSDEPAWAEVDNVTLYNARGKAVSKRFLDALTGSDWDLIHEALAES